MKYERVYSATIRSIYCPRKMKDYFINSFNKGIRKTILQKIGQDVDVWKEHKKGKLAVIGYSQNKNEAHIILNHYWMR